jgi:hypothetical protein
VQLDEKTVRVGLPGGSGGQESGRTRNGAWAPVYANLKAKEAIKSGAYLLVVESTDSEDAPYIYPTPLPALAAGEERLLIGYIRPGTGGSEVRVGLQNAEGKPVQNAPRVGRDTSRDVLQPRDQLYLAIGSRLPGLKRALLPEGPSAGADGRGLQEADVEDRGARRLAFLDSIAIMPDRWFGYDAVDTAILTTGSESFVKQLLDGPEAPQRRRALAEWVRRGGQLVVSVGRNHQLAAAVLEQLPLPEVDKQLLLDCKIGPGVARKQLTKVTDWAMPHVQLNRTVLANVEIAGLQPGPDVHVIVSERSEGADGVERPVLVQGSCGLGRVILVAFDLDTEPFTRWSGQAEFWKRLIAELAPRTEFAAPRGQVPGGGMVERPELGTELRRQLEDFKGIPPVSFGWVALFILFYIILIGPLDYLVLKKVFKRLEFTWITFPTIVIAVSIAAYFTAYALKGEDLRVNKVDLVEVDLQTPQVYGHTWFTLFSPRIQGYTVGVAPAFADNSTAVTVLDDPMRAERTGSQGLFTRPYVYAPDLAGVERVPIPVWATRTFTAAWRAPAPAGGLPVTAAIGHSRNDPTTLTGTVENHLPFDLLDAVIIYRNRWYALGRLPAEGSFRIDNLEVGGKRGKDLESWFTGGGGPGQPGSERLLRAMLFHRHERQGLGMLNSGWRHLDQQWRLTAQAGSIDVYRDETILLARAATRFGRAEELTEGPDSPTRLWLGALPVAGGKRPALPGLLTQDTYVRVYIPVRGR